MVLTKDRELLVRIDERVANLHDRLGNYIERDKDDKKIIHERITDVETKQIKINNKLTQWGSALAVILGGITMFGKYIIEFITNIIR